MFYELTCKTLKQRMQLTYVSLSSQNDIIEVIGFDYIWANIITEIKQAPYFSIIADEVSSHNSEYLSLCLRYIDADCEIQEKFVAFIKLPRIRASDIQRLFRTC